LPASSGAKAAAAAESIRAKLEYPPVNTKALVARHRTQTLAQRAVLDEWAHGRISAINMLRAQRPLRARHRRCCLQILL